MNYSLIIMRQFVFHYSTHKRMSVFWYNILQIVLMKLHIIKLLCVRNNKRNHNLRSTKRFARVLSAVLVFGTPARISRHFTFATFNIIIPRLGQTVETFSRCILWLVTVGRPLGFAGDYADIFVYEIVFASSTYSRLACSGRRIKIPMTINNRAIVAFRRQLGFCITGSWPVNKN